MTSRTTVVDTFRESQVGQRLERTVESVGRYSKLESLAAYAMLAPNLVAFFGFVFLPIVYAFWLSLHDAYLFADEFAWVGLEHYRNLIWEPLVGAGGVLLADGPVAAYNHLFDPLQHPFIASLKNNLIFALLAVPSSVVVGLGLALLVNRQISGIRIVRTVYFVPVVTGMVAVSLVFTYIYNPSYGLLNFLLGTIGLPDTTVWLEEYPMLAIVVMTIWKGAGYNMLLYLAALQGVPESLYKAARVDGAGRFARFRNVTWPLLMPTTLFVVVMSTISSFKVFTQVFVMTDGGPGFRTTVSVFYIYKRAFTEFQMGEASAMSFVLFAVIFLITLVNMRYLQTDVEY
jgi:multiple sugar transport system permease protein